MIKLATAAFLLFALQLGLANAGDKKQESKQSKQAQRPQQEQQGQREQKEKEDVKGFYELTAKSIDGKPVNLSEYKGKVALVVNVASRCGYTPQYEGLQKLHDANKDKGFTVLGFPSNDFRGQEPGTNAEIKTFCQMEYGVKFPLFEKNPVIGAEKQPIYHFLTEQSRKDLQGEVAWNFEKFLVNQNGEVVARWKSGVEPQSEEIRKKLAELLPATKQ